MPWSYMGEWKCSFNFLDLGTRWRWVVLWLMSSKFQSIRKWSWPPVSYCPSTCLQGLRESMKMAQVRLAGLQAETSDPKPPNTKPECIWLLRSFCVKIENKRSFTSILTLHPNGLILRLKEMIILAMQWQIFCGRIRHLSRQIEHTP
jgi:hypothetical protein